MGGIIPTEMREEEEEPNWFAQREAQLPSPEELMPLSQSLITPELALAFDIAPPSHSNTPTPSAPGLCPPPSSSLAGGGGAGSGEEPARTLKRPRLVWTPQLHKRFVDAVAHLGIKNAVPKTIMQLMSVDGLTRENVASHLQKYRLYLKRMQGLSSSAGPGGAPAPGPMSAAEAAEHHLFAAGPLPHHFLHRGPAGAPSQDHYLPYAPMPSLHQHQQLQIATATAAAAQYYNPRHFGGQFDHGFLSRQHATTNHPIMGAATAAAPASNYGDELELGSGGGGGGGGGRKILTLFPTGDD